MFIDRAENRLSVEARVSAMSPQERIALAEELLERGARHLTLFEKYPREHPLAQIEGPTAEVKGQMGGTVPHRITRGRHA